MRICNFYDIVLNIKGSVLFYFSLMCNRKCVFSFFDVFAPRNPAYRALFDELNE